MKLTREDIRINLQGKNEKGLTDIYNLLVSLKQDMYNSLESDLINLRDWKYYEFHNEKWCLSNNVNKKEVTLEELKEILQPMENKEEQLIKEAKERGFLTEGNEFYSCFSDKNKLRIIEPYNSKLEINLYLDKGGCLRYYDGLNNKYDESLCSNPAIYKDGVWAEIKNNDLTLTEQLEKAKEEVQRLEKEIEENKIKEGDWVWNALNESYYKKTSGLYGVGERKITNPELIKLLEQEIK